MASLYGVSPFTVRPRLPAAAGEDGLHLFRKSLHLFLSPASGLPAASTSKNVCGTIHAAAATPLKLLLSHKFFLPERHHHTLVAMTPMVGIHSEFVRPVSCSGPADALSAAYKASGEPLNYGRNYGAKPSEDHRAGYEIRPEITPWPALLKSPASLHPAAGLSLPYGKSHTNHDRYTTTAAKQTKPIWLIFFRRRNVQIQKGVPECPDYIEGSGLETLPIPENMYRRFLD